MSERVLEGKTALVTGASRNIGKAIALAYAEAGANIVINSLQDAEAAAAVQAEITAAGGNAIVQLGSVADRAAVDAMVAAGMDTFGSIDIVVANASARGLVDFLDMDYEQWRNVVDISLDGTFNLTQTTLPGMIEKGWGRIITLGGISWHVGFKRRAHNLTAKSGLVGLTRALAAEFGDRGVTANCISPGQIETVRPASAGERPPMTNPPPVPRMGEVAEIASAAMFLAHPQQGYINGQIIHVNGGIFMGT
ncbi:MAG: SDR family NAD(P)-dependent oxidoreductase [Pseudomonadota bacterium]